MTITKETFMLATKATFDVVRKPRRQPDYVSDSGSQYWYQNDGVIRFADHWGPVATCNWNLGELNKGQHKMIERKLRSIKKENRRLAVFFAKFSLPTAAFCKFENFSSKI